MSEPNILRARDTATGDIVSFKWNGAEPPTEADMAEVFAAHRAQRPPSVADAVRSVPLHAGAGGMTVGDAENAVIGAGKNFLKTVTTGGNLLRKVPGIKQLDEAIGSVELPQSAVTPKGTAQHVGAFIEDTAENVVPSMRAAGVATALTKGLPNAVKVGGQMLAGAAANAATGALHGHTDPAKDAAIGAAGPFVGGAALGTARWLGRKSLPLAQAALKTPVRILKSMPGASKEGIDKMSKRLANTALDERLFNSDAATEAIDETMGQVDAKLAAKAGLPTDAPTRAVRYLGGLRRGAAKSPLAEDATAAINGKEDELLRGRFGEDVQTGVRVVPHPQGLRGPNDKVLTTEEPVIERQLRSSVPVQESREASLAMSKYTPSKWGAQQNAPEEANKAVERATRDAVKSAVPETKPLFAKAQRLVKTREALRIMGQRDANRDVMSLPASAGNIAGVATGKPGAALVGFATQFLKNNQLRLGIYARDLEKALAAGDPQMIGRVLQKVGVSAATIAHESGDTP